VTSDDGTQYVASTTYNAQGQVTEQRLDSGANGFTRQSVYNANTLRLETLKAGTAAPFENLQKLAYAYDLAGNVQTLTDTANSGQVQTFGYDWLDRLTTAATNAAGVGQYSHTYAYNAIGNLTSYNGNAYTYGTKPHAVTAAFGNAYGYDAVGNQTSRTISGVAYTQSFDYDNRLAGVAGGSVSATFLYDAEGNRVKGTVAGVTTVYIAGLYEWQNGAVTKYYEGGALRRTGYATDNGVFYVVSDQLRSTSVLVNRDGTVKSRNFYYPYGGNRGGSAFSGITTKRFTGQYHEQGLPGGEGLSYYNARWYDAQVGVFISADTLVPSPLAPQTLNRYAYTRGNPLRYNDPTGHDVGCPGRDASACGGGGGRSGPKPPTYGVWQPPTQAPRPPKLPPAHQYPYLFSSRYGWIDRGHALPGLAKTVISQVTQKVRAGGGSVVLPRQPSGPRIPILGGHAIYYERRYSISPKVTPEQISGVARGIYEDAGIRYEEWQGGFPIATSRYANEDLPSNYLGFVQALKGWSEERTMSYLGHFTPSKGPPYCAWAECTSPSQPSLPTNDQYQPLVLSGGQWTHVAWPNALSLTPAIASSPDTWQFTGESTTGLAAPLHRNR
jgi:RHS repeat-associated protein